MAISIREIILGQANGDTARLEPNLEGVSIIPVNSPELWSQASIEILSQAEIRKNGEEAPFIRIRAESEHISMAIADDMMARVRILEESIDGRIPLMIDAQLDDETDDPKRDAMITKIARAFDVPQTELLRLALTQAVIPKTREALDDDEKQYLAAHQHAFALAQQVRQLDDQMTASVVPGWLFVASGVGALFVMMTAITLFYPQLKMILIPIMTVFFVLGLSTYGWHSWRELQTRASLQENRRQLRSEREQARADVQVHAKKLKARGLDPDALVLHKNKLLQNPAGPVILSKDELTSDLLNSLQSTHRQVLVFVKADQFQTEKHEALIRIPEPLRVPS